MLMGCRQDTRLHLTFDQLGFFGTWGCADDEFNDVLKVMHENEIKQDLEKKN